jgi:flagellar biosynthesis/type III secretory pathway protein FliH
MRATVVIAVSAAAAFAGLCTTPRAVEPASAAPVALTAQATTLLPADAGDFQRGFRDGYREGYRDGFRDGRDSCDPHHPYGARPFRPGDYEHGYSEGYDNGYRAGFDSGCHHHHFPR